MLVKLVPDAAPVSLPNLSEFTDVVKDTWSTHAHAGGKHASTAKLPLKRPIG